MKEYKDHDHPTEAYQIHDGAARYGLLPAQRIGSLPSGGLQPGHLLPGRRAYDDGGIEALTEKTRRKPCLKNRVPEEVEKAVLDLALDDPSLGQKRLSDTLRLEGIFISPGGVRSVWLRHGLETFKKRLAALEKSVADTCQRFSRPGQYQVSLADIDDWCRKHGWRAVTFKLVGQAEAA